MRAPTFDEAMSAALAVYVREWFDTHPEVLGCTQEMAA